MFRLIYKGRNRMRTINKGPKTGGEVVTAAAVKVLADDDRQPCWYADSEEEENTLVWTLGVKGGEDDKEDAFEFANDSTYKSKSFVCSLLDKYKEGGKEAVEGWLQNGCP